MKDNSHLKNNGPGSASREADHLLFQWNSEIFSLYNKRMREYCMLPFNLMTCQSLDEVAELQNDFMETLRMDYCTSAERLSHVVDGAREEAGDVYSETLLKAQDDARAILDQAKAQAKRIIADAETRVRPEANSGNGAAAAAA